MKKFLALFLAMMMALSLVACGGKEEPTPEKEDPAAEEPAPEKEDPAAEELTVGIFVKDNTNPFWRYVVKGAMQAGEDLGVKVVEYTPAEASNVEQQVSLVQDAIQADIDGMAVVAVDSAALLDSCKQAMEAYKTSPSDFEKFTDDRLMMLAKESCKRASEGAEPLLGYYLGEEAEKKVLHIIYSGIKTGADQDTIRERLREIYG